MLRKTFIRKVGFRPKVPYGLVSFLASRLYIKGPSAKMNAKLRRDINQRVASFQMLKQLLFFARRLYALRNYNVSGKIASFGLFLCSPCARDFFKVVLDDVWNALLGNDSPLHGLAIMTVINSFNSNHMLLMAVLAKHSGHTVCRNTPSLKQLLKDCKLPRTERLYYVMGIVFFSQGKWNEGFACLQHCSFPQAKLAMIEKSLHGYGNLFQPNVIFMLKSLVGQNFEPAKLLYVRLVLQRASGVDAILSALQEFDKLFPDGHPSLQNFRPNLLKRLSATTARIRREVRYCTHQAVTARECATVSNERLQRSDSKRNRASFGIDEAKAVGLEAIAAQKAQEADAYAQQIVQVMALLQTAKKEAKAAAKREAKVAAKEEAKSAVKREREDAKAAVKRESEDTTEAKAASKKTRREE